MAGRPRNAADRSNLGLCEGNGRSLRNDGLRHLRSPRPQRSAACASITRTRLKIVEAYDPAGFYAYHLAEHHSTPLGMAPSPSVFLAAVAQRTRRLRFGALVYAMPLHHPLRLIEEICMLDHLSGGRVEIGLRPRLGADRAGILRRKPGRRAGDLRGRRRADPARPHRWGAGFPASGSLSRRADGDRAAAAAASADLVRRAFARQRRARGAAGLNTVSLDPPGDDRARPTAIARLGGELHPGGRAAASSGSAASSWWRRPTPRPWRSRAAPIRAGTQASHTCSAAMAASQIHPRPADFDTLMARGQGIAGSPATVRGVPDVPARRDRLQLRGRAVRLRRPHARRDAALD